MTTSQMSDNAYNVEALKQPLLASGILRTITSNAHVSSHNIQRQSQLLYCVPTSTPFPNQQFQPHSLKGRLLFFETFYCGGAPRSLTLLNPTKKTEEYNIYITG
jgi:hypothetical protein